MATSSNEQPVQPHAAAVLSWIHDAGNPYFDWLFGDSATAANALARWLHRPESEVALHRVRPIPPHEPVGGYIALTASELRAARRADALALVGQSQGDQRRALLTRLRETSELFTEPANDELYLSKMGVRADRRGRGHGRGVLDAFLAEASARGFSRTRLDVCTDNRSAISLYRSAGFVPVGEQQSRAGLAYVAMARSTV